MRSGLFLFVIILLGLGSAASSADRSAGVCRRIASMLDAGLGDTAPGTRPYDLLETLAHHSRGRLSIARWQADGSERTSYLRALHVPEPSGITMLQIETAALPRQSLVAVMDIDGSAACMIVSLFQSVRHRLIEVVPPSMTRRSLCKRWGDSIWLARFDGKPVLVMERSDKLINFSEWINHSWAPICGVAVTYVPSLISEAPVCARGNCAAAESASRRIIGNLKLIDNNILSRSSNRPDFMHLLDLMDRTEHITEVPAGPSRSVEDGYMFNPRQFFGDFQGHPTLGLADKWLNGHAIDSEEIGYLVTLWQADGDKLSRIAAYHFRTAHSAIKSVSVLPLGG